MPRPLRELLAEAVYFPREFEAIEAEFCGAFPTALLMLPPAKRDRLAEWLEYPTDERRQAYEEAKSWAIMPIAAALDRLKKPLKYVAPAGGKPAPPDKTVAALAAWLDESEEAP